MNMPSLVLAAVVSFSCLPALAQTAQPAMDMPGMDMGGTASPATAAYMKAMQGMDAAMQAVKPTGDPDKDFVLMMKPHHQAAVEMATAYLRYGKDPVLKKMAHDIIVGQDREIAAMTKWQAGRAR